MTLHLFPPRDIPATPEVAAEIFERIGRATLRLFVDACRAEGREVEKRRLVPKGTFPTRGFTMLRK